MPDTIQAERRFTTLEQYVRELFEECRETIEESKRFIAQKESKREIKGTLDCSSRFQNALKVVGLNRIVSFNERRVNLRGAIISERMQPALLPGV